MACCGPLGVAGWDMLEGRPGAADMICAREDQATANKPSRGLIFYFFLSRFFEIIGEPGKYPINSTDLSFVQLLDDI
jgi:hypothetical protein